MLNNGIRIPAGFRGAGQFVDQNQAPTKSASVRTRLKDLLSEETHDETGRKLTWADRVARGLIERAATGNVPAVQLLIDQTDGPISQAADPNWQVTINYVHQQLNVHQPDKHLVPPPSPTLSEGTFNTD